MFLLIYLQLLIYPGHSGGESRACPELLCEEEIHPGWRCQSITEHHTNTLTPPSTQSHQGQFRLANPHTGMVLEVGKTQI